MSAPLEMTRVEQMAIDSLKARGFAVIVWTPEEIGRANADELEEISIERGWHYINQQNGPENDEEAE